MWYADDRPLVAFLGPSLPAAEALRIVPEVDIWPPICQGDLTTVVERLRPRAVLIVDGAFSQSLSVWHKEILHALHLGIRVVGASSAPRWNVGVTRKGSAVPRAVRPSAYCFQTCPASSVF
jgi:hypothetical protein